MRRAIQRPNAPSSSVSSSHAGLADDGADEVELAAGDGAGVVAGVVEGAVGPGEVGLGGELVAAEVGGGDLRILVAGEARGEALAGEDLVAAGAEDVEDAVDGEGALELGDGGDGRVRLRAVKKFEGGIRSRGRVPGAVNEVRRGSG